MSCPFCAYATGHDQNRPVEWVTGDVMAFEPLGPFAPGHLLIVPAWHVESIATADERLVGEVMTAASEVARRHDAANIITSIGEAATQTVMHWHVHVIPRHEGDQLGGWPWRPGQTHAHHAQQP